MGWRTGDTHKFSSASFDDYDPQEQIRIRGEIEKLQEQEKARKKKIKMKSPYNARKGTTLLTKIQRIICTLKIKKLRPME